MSVPLCAVAFVPCASDRAMRGGVSRVRSFALLLNPSERHCLVCHLYQRGGAGSIAWCLRQSSAARNGKLASLRKPSNCRRCEEERVLSGVLSLGVLVPSAARAAPHTLHPDADIRIVLA